MPPERARHFKPPPAAWRAVLLAALAQSIGVLVLLGWVQASWRLAEVAPPLWAKLLCVSTVAGFITWFAGLPRWWMIIQAILPPATYMAMQSDIPGWIFGIGFFLLLIVFKNTAGERVPLYLSNTTTWAALSKLAGKEGKVRFVDLGCGLGGTLIALSRTNLHPESRFHGVETAPFPFIVSWLRCKLARDPRLSVAMRSIWDLQFSKWDLLYAFLSPEPMPRLLDKAHREMHENAVFVSNSFEDPQRPASEHLQLDDGRKTMLHIWRGPPRKGMRSDTKNRFRVIFAVLIGLITPNQHILCKPN